MRPDYLTTAQAFDAIAPDYDAAYGPDSNAIMAWLRQESLALLQETFPPGSRLLEIGCGTGDEALYLAQAGYTILATDISARMAARTHAKARAAGLADRVTALVLRQGLRALALPGGGLDALRPPLPFDGAYASFGSLNCEPKLPRMADALAGLLRPGAAFVCSVMGRWCLFELAWFLLHGRPRTAFRRLPRGWHPAPVTGSEGFQVSVLVRYLSVEEVARVFAPAFTVERVLALPLFLPPPYLENLFRQHRVLFGRLEVWERRLRERWPWRYLGDHVALVLRKL